MQAHGYDVHRAMLTVLMILAYTTAHASTPGEEHTHAIFQDDFEDFDPNTWDLQIGPATSYGAYWKILDEDGNNVLSVKGTVVVDFRAHNWTDYTVMVRIKLIEAPEDVRVVVRTGDSGAGYSFGFSQGEIEIYKSLRWGTEPTYITKFLSGFGVGNWHTIKIVCIENMFWLYVDNQLMYEYQDDTDPILSGKINFGCGPNTHVYYDDVWVAVTHADYVEIKITGAQTITDLAKAAGADVEEPEKMIEEARAKLEEGDLDAAGGLASMAAEKAKGLLELATSEAQEQQQETQQQPAQTAPPLSIERVATIITICGAVTGVGGWIFKTRGDRRKRAILFRELMQAADDVYERHRSDGRQCEAELQRIKDRVINEYKKNLITEKDYHALDEKIKEYVTRLREAPGNHGQGTW